MKKWIAILSVAALLLALAACGKGGNTAVTEPESSTIEETTEDPTKPEIGRVAEKDGFYVYVPDQWCKMEYSSNGYRIRLFDIPSAPDIEDDTPEVEILVSAEDSSKEELDAAVQELLAIDGAKAGKDTKLGGYDFSVVSYKHAEEKRTYTVYTGLAGGKLATVTLKGISAKDEDVSEILKSLSFKA